MPLTLFQGSLNLIEIFASVQGETSFVGLPTTFVRLAACNLRCSWCDTTYSFGRGTPWSLEKIVTQVQDNGCPYVCITGGEPLLQKNVHSLMTHLLNLGFHLSIETGGSLPIDPIDERVKVILDIKCPGSGMEKKNDWKNLAKIKMKDEVKFVVLDENDYLFSKSIIEKYDLLDRNIPILLSPVFDVLDPKVLVEWMLKDKLPCRLNLQIHKWIWSKDTKGV